MKVKKLLLDNLHCAPRKTESLEGILARLHDWNLPTSAINETYILKNN